MKPKITFVNHASYIMEYGDMRMICDPWTEGRTFDHSWALLSPSRFKPADFAGITHIWFSHEHPDHFFPPNLLAIPPEIRAKVHVIFRHTEDHKIRDWCLKNGFAGVTELPLRQWVDIGSGVRVMCGPCADDSWLYLEAGGVRILNVNDCAFNPAGLEEVKSLTVNNPDVLFTQFSYASYVGDRNRKELREKAARLKLDEVLEQTQVFKPGCVVPFASYVWFCHEENFYLNDSINRIGDAVTWFKERGLNTVVLYPGDEWEAGTPHDSSSALARYTADYAVLEKDPPLTRTKTVSLEELSAKMKTFTDSVRKQFGVLGRFIYIRPQKVHLIDLKETVELSLGSGLRRVTGTPGAEKADWEMTSGALSFCLSFMWGFNTLHVAGKFNTTSVPAYNALCQYVDVADAVNHNHGTWPFLKMSIKNRLKSVR